MDGYWIHESTRQIEGIIRKVCDEAPVGDKVTCDVLEWYAKIGLNMVDLLGTLYNRDLDDFTKLKLEHHDVLRPLWAAIMYFTVPQQEKWIWKDEAMSLIMPFSVFSEAAEKIFPTPQFVDVDDVGDIDQDGQAWGDVDPDDLDDN